MRLCPSYFSLINQDVNFVIYCYSVVEKMFKSTNDSNPVHWKGHLDATPLHAACKNSHLKIVKELIEKGADIKAE